MPTASKRVGRVDAENLDLFGAVDNAWHVAVVADSNCLSSLD